MKALKRKWNSSRGASILLALLFLLVCMMAGASVVMAAASNAGKIRSNKEEQQKYLTLISAVTLLCDELQSVEYVGGYTITTKGPQPDKSEDRLKPGRAKVGEAYDQDDYNDDDYYKTTTYTYTWQTGDLRARGDGAKIEGNQDWTGLQEILPLLDNWENDFAEQFKKNAGGTFKIIGNDLEDQKVYKYDETAPSLTGPADSYTLTLTVVGSSETVRVTITPFEQEKRDSIILVASISIDGYSMEVQATLEPTGGRGPKNLSLPEPPGQLENSDFWTYNEVEKTYKLNEDAAKAVTVTWELVAIEKKVQE